VSGREDAERFLGLIGGLGREKERHQEAIVEYFAPRLANTNRDAIPSEAWRALAVPAMQVAGISSRQMQRAIGIEYCGTTLYKQNLGRERAARVASAVQSLGLAALATSDVYWDVVASIEPDGEDDVYDLTVDGHHNFVAGDIVVHNSIEQDSDMVLFIYRDRFYNDNLPEDKRNVAEIIIAKHRNGPVGKIDLLFVDEQTRFVNLDKRR
jgi:replicative DNA helicase